jgi:single-stranded-DNA-specific exonuclease
MKIKAIAWRWGDRFPLPSPVDIAYKLRENTWNGNTSIELELVGVRLPATSSPASCRRIAEFDYNQRHYTCSLSQPLNELRIRNPEGKVLAIQQGQKIGILGKTRSEAHEVDITQAPYYQLIQAAMRALAMPGNK